MKKNIIIKIDISKIREEVQKIKEINDMNLTGYQKKLKILTEVRTYHISNIKDNKYDEGKEIEKEYKEKEKINEKGLISKINNYNIIKNNKFKININQLWEEMYQQKILNINESYPKKYLYEIYYAKKNFLINLNSIREEKNNKKVDIQIYINNKEKEINTNNKILKNQKEKKYKESKDSYINLENKENQSISLNDSSLNKIEFSEGSLNAEISEKKFNPLRANFYKKHKLYDIILNESTTMKLHHPEKYKIDAHYFGFLYPNDLVTFCITKSAFLTNGKRNESYSNSINALGLYFCGKLIKIEGELKKCRPNSFICKDCMIKNKKNYNIKNNYFININGRVAKKNKGKYHCFGHFLSRNVIEDCINQFTCKACQMFESYSEYYL